MTRPKLLAILLLLFCSGAYAQHPSLEGYWQDTARRILYSRLAPADYVYGQWTALDQAQTYPAAKQVQRSGTGWNVVDLNFDDTDYAVVTTAGSDTKLEFVRTVKWNGCAMRHQCTLRGEEMVCALENVCPVDGKQVIDWRGEERYARRASCERQGRVQLQGYPVACR